MAKSLQEQARTVASELAGHLGDNLSSLILFGSAVRGGYDPGHADANMLLVVRDASTAALRPVEPAIADWVKRGGPPPLIFTEDEWRASTDVFPIEIEDMREAHQSLHGANPFDGIETDRRHLRHELEREIRGKLLQLRAEYAACAPDGRALTRLLIESVGTFFVLMRATVRLVGGTPEADPAALVQQVATAANLDADSFGWVVDKIRGRTVQALRPSDPIGARYVDELQKLARFVDEFDGASAASADARPDGTSAAES